jgi:hypothetical protein
MKGIFMNRSSFLFAIVAILLITTPLISQPSGKGYMDAVNQFFSLIQQGKYNEAVDHIYSSNPWMKDMGEDIAKVKSGLSNLPSLAGTFLGYEKINDASIASGFVHLNYIVNYERQPIRFYFSFHKVRDKWITYAFGYKDDLGDWADEKAKNLYINSH